MKKFNTITGKELLSKEVREIPFIVKDLIPIGLTLIAGSAKVGKSWLALWLSIAVAKGETVWGYETTRCTTLYLCYEDNEIRIQNRLLEITDERHRQAVCDAGSLRGEKVVTVIFVVQEKTDREQKFQHLLAWWLFLKIGWCLLCHPIVNLATQGQTGGNSGEWLVPMKCR